MRKRIALFILGLVLAVCAFWGYQYFSGAAFLGPRKVASTEGEESRINHSPTYEQRAPNGDLLYLLSAQKAAPVKDENGKALAGQYDLTQPTATYYTTDGNLLFIRADHGTIGVNDRTGTKAEMNDRFRGAHLSGNVVLTYGPRESFTDNGLDIKPEQLQVRFEKDLDLNYTEGVVTSPGLVHLRAGNDRVRFDGENLTIAFNRSQKKQEIELLRIEPTSGKDNYMLIKDVGRQGFSLDQPTTQPTGGNGALAVTTSGTTTGAATQLATTASPNTAPAVASTAPAKAGKSAAVVYKVSLGKEVTATLGGRKLTSDQLFVFFQSPAKQGGKGTATAKSTDSTPPGTPTATATAPASAPTPTMATSAPAPKQAPDDLAVTWTGPMEMRPAGDNDVHLADPHDIALQAIGTPERPVTVNDETRVARSGTLQYNRASQSIDLEPGTVGPVVITDADAADPVKSLRTLTCQGVTFSRNDNQVHLAGPGHVEVPQSVLKNDPKATGDPLVLTWEKKLDIELTPTAPGKNSKRADRGAGYVIHRALFTGKSSITNVDFHMDSEALDIAVAPPAAGGAANTGSTESHATQALEHLLASGAVHVKFANRTGAGIADADQPSGLNADRLEVLTAMASGAKSPSPSRLLAQGNVEAWAYQPPQGEAAQGGKSTKLSKQTLYTPKFDVTLAPKAKTSKDASASGPMGNVTYTSLVATDGVIVELEGFSAQTIFAKAKTLTADLTHGRTAATVTLDGERMPDGTEAFAEVSQGERGDNKISGLKILLYQKERSIDIPGRGTFDFLQPQKAGEEPMPAEVTWTKSMHYDSRSLLAHFVGDIDGHLVGKTDQISKLTCNDYLDVQLASDATAPAAPTPPTTAPASHNKLRLASITAQGNVQVQGTNLDPAGKVLTSLYLTKTERLTYTETSKTLDVPGPGQLLIQDYRTDAKNNTKSTAAAGGNATNSHGDTVFTWDKSLSYAGPTGTITFLKNVYMKHLPLKPFKVPGAKPAAGATATPVNGAAPVDNPPLTLTTDMLVAKLEQSKTAGGGDTVASPIAMGSGGNQQLSSVMADGRAVLKLGESSLTSQRLTFDNHTHIATATAKDIETPVEIFRPGEGIERGDEITWDMTKDKNAVTVHHPMGAMQQN